MELPTLSLFREKKNAQLRDHLKDLELFELVKTDKVHADSRTCWKHNKNECRFSYGRYFTDSYYKTT